MNVESHLIPGPAGQLEANLILAEAGDVTPACSSVAVLCHPHSLYGGSMHDAVLEVLGEACLEADMSVLKFNFRGVGDSDGTFDNGQGEVDDILAVVKWLQAQYPESRISLGGYSFGAAMALLAASRLQQDIVRVMLIAPPIQMVESDAALVLPIKVVVGGRDTIVSARAAAQYFNASQIEVLPRADHFFAGGYGDIKKIMSAFIQSTGAEE